MSEAMRLAIGYYLTDERVSKAVSNVYSQREHEVLRLEKEIKELRTDLDRKKDVNKRLAVVNTELRTKVEELKELVKEALSANPYYAEDVAVIMNKLEGGQDE